jgi:thioredoxin reductase
VNTSKLPVVVIGAGPVGLAAATHLLERGLEPLVLEAGIDVGTNLRAWSHVRMFSPWQYNMDRSAARLLENDGWTPPDPHRHPTGGELVERYLEPLSRVPALASRIRYRTRVTGVSHHRLDVMKTARRDEAAYVVHVQHADEEYALVARAVIDASGTWSTPNPLGSSGLPALGERANAAHVAYGIPDVRGTERARYAGKRVLVVGSGHSAFNALVDLARLAQDATGTAVHWAIRRGSLSRVLGGGENDALAERGALGLRVRALVESGAIVLHTAFQLERLRRSPDGIVASDGERELPAVDELIGATGFRPDLALLGELRLDLDPATQSPRALAPLIDPNVHSCGTVRPHGAQELSHPDAGVYVVGMKSYGRAPTFLLLTGYEQVRSIAAELAGDRDQARRVELVLPETGVCSTQFADETSTLSACCTPAAAPAARSCGTAGARATDCGAEVAVS